MCCKFWCCSPQLRLCAHSLTNSGVVCGVTRPEKGGRIRVRTSVVRHVHKCGLEDMSAQRAAGVCMKWRKKHAGSSKCNQPIPSCDHVPSIFLKSQSLSTNTLEPPLCMQAASMFSARCASSITELSHNSIVHLCLGVWPLSAPRAALNVCHRPMPPTQLATVPMRAWTLLPNQGTKR